MDFIQLVLAVAAVLGAKEGLSYARHRFNGKRRNNPAQERRNHLLTAVDREFLRECFDGQIEKFEKCLEEDRTKLQLWISDRG